MATLRLWKKFLRSMDQSDRNRLCEIAIDRLLETEEIAFRMDGDEAQQDGEDECFYWPGNGENVLNDSFEE